MACFQSVLFDKLLVGIPLKTVIPLHTTILTFDQVLLRHDDIFHWIYSGFPRDRRTAVLFFRYLLVRRHRYSTGGEHLRRCVWYIPVHLDSPTSSLKSLIMPWLPGDYTQCKLQNEKQTINACCENPRFVVQQHCSCLNLWLMRLLLYFGKQNETLFHKDSQGNPLKPCRQIDLLGLIYHVVLFFSQCTKSYTVNDYCNELLNN